MINVKWALIGLAALLMTGRPAHSQFLNWGMEASQCGNSSFSITAGNGSDIYLNNISGIVSATVLATDQTAERQALISIAADSAVNGSVTGNPSLPGYNNEVNRGLYVVSVKQTGTNVVHIPFAVAFPNPILIPRGAFVANFSIATSNPAGNPAPGLCLDAEAHIELVWQTSP